MPLLLLPFSFTLLPSSFHPPHLLFVSFLQPHLLALQLFLLRCAFILSFFPTRFLSLLLSFFFPLRLAPHREEKETFAWMLV